MPVLQFNQGLLREFKTDELSNNVYNAKTKVITTTSPTTIATISINTEDSKNPIWLSATIGWLADDDAGASSRIYFKIFRSIDGGTPQLIFSGVDTIGASNRAVTNGSHVDFPSVTPCKSNVVYQLTVEKFATADLNYTITGPITFVGAEIQFKDNLVQITHTPDNL